MISTASRKKPGRTRGRWALGALVVFICGFVVSSGFAKELTAEKIRDNSLGNNTLGFKDSIAEVSLVLINKRGKERVRRIEIKSIERSDLNKILVLFLQPADVAGTAFLRLDKEDDVDDQYLYLPALGKVKRITGRQRNHRFMGTDLTYADLESRDLKNSNVKRLPDENLGNSEVYVIEAIPRENTDSQYGKTISWIHKKSFVPLRVKFYDKQMELLKVLKVHRLEKKNGNWVAMDSRIHNVQKNTKTRMIVENIDFTAKLDASDFTKRALKGG